MNKRVFKLLVTFTILIILGTTSITTFIINKNQRDKIQLEPPRFPGINNIPNQCGKYICPQIECDPVTGLSCGLFLDHKQCEMAFKKRCHKSQQISFKYDEEELSEFNVHYMPLEVQKEQYLTYMIVGTIIINVLLMILVVKLNLTYKNRRKVQRLQILDVE